MRGCILLTLAALAALSATAAAASPVQPLAAPLGPPVGDAALAGLRGGFLSVDGRVTIAFGLRQTVSVDGVPVAVADAVGTAALPLLVTQIGANNTADINAGLNPGVVLQNTLDGRQLQVQRVIDVTVDSLQRLQGLTLQRSVLSGLVASLQR